MDLTRRLSLDTLPDVPAASRPAVRPGDVGAGVLHLGLGAFHRAHQAVYTERAIAAGGGDWAIVAVAPRSRDVLDPLTAQDCLFSVTTLDADQPETRAVGSIRAALHAASDPDAVRRHLADPAIRVVTMTVTEKAYRADAVIPGLLASGLAARARADAAPIALVSCDNLTDNGGRLRSAVEQAADLLPDDGVRLREWLAAHVTFPSTMVDRIVPATTDATLRAARQALGVADLAAVAAEPFTQWIVEDAFPGGRPAWDAAGAVLTDDVASWERLKLRVVNGVHSAVAYLGAVADCDTIAEALELPGMRGWLDRFLADDVLPTLSPPDQVDLERYASQVLARFANTAVPYRTLQVAMDGSQKLPHRILRTALDRRQAGAEPAAIAFAVAGWMRFLTGRTDEGRTLPLDDPLAEPIRAALAAAGEAPADVVDAVLRLDGVFPAELASDDTFRRLVADALRDLTRHGVRHVLADAA